MTKLHSNYLAGHNHHKPSETIIIKPYVDIPFSRRTLKLFLDISALNYVLLNRRQDHLSHRSTGTRWDEDSKTRLTKKTSTKQKHRHHQPKSYLSNNIPKMIKRLLQPTTWNLRIFAVKQSALLRKTMAGKEVSLKKL